MRTVEYFGPSLNEFINFMGEVVATKGWRETLKSVSGLNSTIRIKVSNENYQIMGSTIYTVRKILASQFLEHNLNIIEHRIIIS